MQSPYIAPQPCILPAQASRAKEGFAQWRKMYSLQPRVVHKGIQAVVKPLRHAGKQGVHGAGLGVGSGMRGIRMEGWCL